MNESLPSPTRWFTGADEHGRDVSVPVWRDALLGDILPWSEGVTIDEDYTHGADAEQVQAAGLALLAVAKHMRESTISTATGANDE